MTSTKSIGAEIMAQLAALKEASEHPDHLTRRYLTPEHKRAHTMVGAWMQDAGMSVRVDAIGNIIGRYEAATPGAPALMMGSHLDTVVDGGAFDGMLGVVLPVACIKQLNDTGQRFPFALEVVGFADEEGVRFKSTYLGSRAIAGTFDDSVLNRVDDAGVSMADALREFGLDPDNVAAAKRAPDEVLAFVETHIEQGPVLEDKGLPLGIVTAIAGATRLELTVSGTAGHAGTVPMALRHDAATAAAEIVLAVEQRCSAEPGLVGTVGQLSVHPGAVNVIPGEAMLSIDIRAADDARRLAACDDIRAQVIEIANRRDVDIAVRETHSADSRTCAPWLRTQLADAVRGCGVDVIELQSGAGHDAAAMMDLTDIAMLFVRCEKGISHNPAENMTAADADQAANALLKFINNFNKHK